jgi:hypothetical protein
MNQELDRVTRRLAEIQDALLALPPGPSQDRYRLLSERDSLRADAAVFKSAAIDDKSDDDLEAEARSLRHLRDQITKARTGYATSKGGNNAGATSGAWVDLAAKGLGGEDMGRINARLSQIEDILAARRQARGRDHPDHG